MRWKKPKWVQNVQKAADNVVKPITTAAPVKAVQKAAEKVVQAVTPPPMPKPPVLERIQTVAQKAADNVGQGLKDAAKDTGTAVQKAADKVADVVRPAAQTVAKEVGYAVNPVLGEIKYRVDNAGKNETIQRIGDKLKQGVRSATDINTRQVNAGGNDNFEFLPYFTNKMPRAIIDMGGGLFNTTAGIVTADGQRVLSGLKRTGSGVVDAAKHTGLGTLEVIGLGGGRGTSKTYTNRGSTVEEYEDEPRQDGPRTTVPSEEPLPKGQVIASGGAAVNAIPKPMPDTDDKVPGGSQGTAGPGNPAAPKTPAPVLGLTSNETRPFTPAKQKKKEKPSTLDKIKKAVKLPKKRRK